MSRSTGVPGGWGIEIRPIKDKERFLPLLVKPQRSSARGEPKHKGLQGGGQGTSFPVLRLEAAVSGHTVLNSGRRGDLAGPRSKRREDQRRVQGGEANLSRVWAVSEWGR